MPLLLVRGLLRDDGKRGLDEAVRVVHLEVLALEFFFARLVGQVPADLVAVFFGLEEGNQVDAGPHFFTAEFTKFPGFLSVHCSGRREEAGHMYRNSLAPCPYLYQP